MTQESSLKDLLNTSDDELLLELGLYLLGGEKASSRGEQDDASLRRRALNWLARHWVELQQVARNSPMVDGMRSDKAILLATLVDYIAQHGITEPGAVVAAAVIAKLGLDVFCASDSLPWNR